MNLNKRRNKKPAGLNLKVDWAVAAIGGEDRFIERIRDVGLNFRDVAQLKEFIELPPHRRGLSAEQRKALRAITNEIRGLNDNPQP